MADKKELKLKADQINEEKIKEVNKILGDIASGKVSPQLFSLHVKI